MANWSAYLIIMPHNYLIFLSLGFSLDFDRNLALGITEDNNSSAKQFPNQLSYGPMLGLFPFQAS